MRWTQSGKRGRRALRMRIGLDAIRTWHSCTGIGNLNGFIQKRIREQQRPERAYCSAQASGRIGEDEHSAANPHHTHQSFLDVNEFALALVFFLGAVSEGFFQQEQVAAEFELAE